MSNLPDKTSIPPQWLAGEGEMRRLIRGFNWSKHPLGEPEFWPQSLKTIIRMMLDSRYAMWMGWGPNLTFFYNDAYARDTLGKKHPWALGRPAREVWAEIWPEIGPRIERVLNTGEATWDEGLLLFLERSDYLEETYHTFSYSPLYDDQGARGGMLCVVTEETKRVISERRLSLLRELGANTTLARTIDEACSRFVQTLGHNSADVPFALIYLLDTAQRRLLLKGAVQVSENHPARFPAISLDARSKSQWPAGKALAEKKLIVVPDVESTFGSFSGGKYPESPHFAAVLPIPGADAEHPIGSLVLGVSPRRALDDDYEGFFQLIAGQFATAISNAQSFEKERQRAEALTELDRAKTAFFSNVSHEFRTPLTLILGPLEELLRRGGSVTPDQVRGELEVIHRNSLRLLKLVNTLLDFSRIEAGRNRAIYEQIDLSAFTADLTSAFRSIMEKAGLRLDVDCEPIPEPMFVDRDMWEKIVFNLLSNAFKFTFEGGVSVRLSAENGCAVLRVADTGAGIPAEEIGGIFKRFHRVQNARARTHEGTGIGLALVHELVKLHGGSISVESQPGQGAAFTVRIPFGNAHLPTDRVGVPRLDAGRTVRGEAFIQEASRWELPNRILDLNETVVSQPETPRGLSRVLIADDNADMRDYITRLLRGRYELETVADGAAALKAAQQRKPDIILSDVMMPGMDGFALLKAIREDVALRQVPVIFISARAGDEALIEGIQQGADDYLVKPFSGRELLARLETHLKLARIRNEALAAQAAIAVDNAQLYRAAQRLAAIVESSDEIIIGKDLNGVITSWNKGAERIFGYTAEEVVGKSVTILMPPDRVSEEARILASIRRGERIDHYETVRRRKDGTLIDVSLSVSPIKDANGEVIGASKVGNDITDRVRAKEKLEALVAERTSSLREAIAQMEEFSYTVSHDLRAPVRAMKGYAIAALEDYGNQLDDKGRNYLNRIVQSGERMDRLIRDVLCYSRVARAVITIEPVDLDRLVREILQHYPEFDSSRARITIAGKLPRVKAHELSLSQVISNLLSNAVKFVPPGITPEILIRAEAHNGLVKLWIEDNGIGIAPEYRHRLFGMFERIAPDGRYEGTGIGLAIVRKATERMGGKVGVESDGLHGSKFWVELPAA